MKNILVFSMALIVMMAVDTIKNVLLVMYFFTINPGEGVSLSIFIGTAIGVIIFCCWSACIYQTSTSTEMLFPKIATITVAIMLPLKMYLESRDMAITLNQVSGEILGIIFAHLARWFNKNFVSE